MMEPVQPRPTITTSRFLSFFAISARCRVPVRPAAADRDRRQREALVIPPDPVAVIIARAGKADHLPGAHAAIPAIDRVGEEAVLCVLDQHLEEAAAARPLELQLAGFDPVDELVLVRPRKLVEALPRIGGA